MTLSEILTCNLRPVNCNLPFTPFATKTDICLSIIKKVTNVPNKKTEAEVTIVLVSGKMEFERNMLIIL